MAEEKRISPAVIIPIGLGLGLAVALGVAALALAAPPKVYICPVCGDDFTTEAELNYHIRTTHPPEEVPEYISNINYTCPPSREGERINIRLSAELLNGYVYKANFVSPQLKEPMTLRVPVGQEAGYLPFVYSQRNLEGTIWADDCVNPVLVDEIDGEYFPPRTMVGAFQIEVYSVYEPDFPSSIKELVYQTKLPATLHS